MIIRTKNKHGWDTLILTCACNLHEHTMWYVDITGDTKDSDVCYPEVSLDVHLKPDYNIIRRIWTAIRYIFGYRSKYGDFDEVLLEYEAIEELNKFCTDFLLKYYKRNKL